MSMEYCLRVDPDRPSFHVMAARGWINDPNGPLYYNGVYHIFYQHVPESVEWEFGIVWGHAASTDLATWRHLPFAVSPSKGHPDADGCFSGCCVVDEKSGLPTILYTGVRLRNNPDFDHLPHPDHDLGLPFIESQCCAAQANLHDPTLGSWSKSSEGVATPPRELGPASNLVGWRDPFVFEKKKGENGDIHYTMLIGSGIKDQGGTALVYRTLDMMSKWEYAGLLCAAKSTATGYMWECPLLADLSGGSPSNGEDRDHFFCISPDAPTKRTIYWIGGYKDGDFLLDDAIGPYKLDLGDVLYAPNILDDDHGGRKLLWGWLQEGPDRQREANYSGCLSIPRILSLKDGQLFQEPAPEIKLLRKQGGEQRGFPREIDPEDPAELKHAKGPHLDIEVTFERGTASLTGLFVKAWEGSDDLSAAILYDWELLKLETVYGFKPLIEAEGDARDQYEALKCVGGQTYIQPGDSVTLRVLIDGSCVEVFTSTGAAMSVRIYRGSQTKLNLPNNDSSAAEDTVGDLPHVNKGSGISFIAVGGSCTVSSVSAWEMRSCWVDESAESLEWGLACVRHTVVPCSMMQGYKYGDSKFGRCHVCHGLHSHGACSKEPHQ